MTASLLLIVLVSQVSSVGNDKHFAPPEARKTTYSISSKASAMIDPLNGRTLAEDTVFIRTLSEVLKNPDFADTDKALAVLRILGELPKFERCVDNCQYGKQCDYSSNSHGSSTWTRT